jgi:hypothetical protein
MIFLGFHQLPANSTWVEMLQAIQSQLRSELKQKRVVSKLDALFLGEEYSVLFAG